LILCALQCGAEFFFPISFLKRRFRTGLLVRDVLPMRQTRAVPTAELANSLVRNGPSTSVTMVSCGPALRLAEPLLHDLNSPVGIELHNLGQAVLGAVGNLTGEVVQERVGGQRRVAAERSCRAPHSTPTYLTWACPRDRPACQEEPEYSASSGPVRSFTQQQHEQRHQHQRTGIDQAAEIPDHSHNALDDFSAAVQSSWPRARNPQRSPSCISAIPHDARLPI
jgi:hypothetical protein